MKWYRHFTSSRTDTVLSEIESELGNDGYAKYYKLHELIVEGMERPNSPPIVETSEKRLCQALNTNRKGLNQFLELLQNISETTVEHSGNMIKIKTPWIAELLDKNSMSSKARRASGEPRIEENRIDKIIKDKNIVEDKIEEPVNASITSQTNIKPRTSFKKQVNSNTTSTAVYKTASSNSSVDTLLVDFGSKLRTLGPEHRDTKLALVTAIKADSNNSITFNNVKFTLTENGIKDIRIVNDIYENLYLSNRSKF